MTSSLVGSEMCIRDRVMARLIARGLPGSVANGFRGVRLLGAMLGVAPVSYTHLTLPTICSV
eukprot:7818434-Prorocentrum_lima.AAC.1